MKEIVALLCQEHGATKKQIKQWRQRGMVPHKFRAAMLETARRKDWPVALSDFDFKPSLESEIPAWEKRMARAGHQVGA